MMSFPSSLDHHSSYWGSSRSPASPGRTTLQSQLASLSLIRIALLGIGFGAYSDFVSSSPLGMVMALMLFTTVVYWALARDYGQGLQLFLITMLLSPLVDRDMVQITRLTGVLAPVNGILTTRVLSFSLVQWGFVFFGTAGFLLHVKRHRAIRIPRNVRTVFACNLILMLVLLLATLLDSIAAREFIDFRAVVSDLRFFLIALYAIFTALFFVDDPKKGRTLIEKALLVAAVAGGVKAVFFLCHDFLANRTSLYFNPQPYVFFPVFYAAVYLGPRKTTIRFSFIVLMAFFSAFSISRGDMFFGLVSAVIFIMLLLFIPNTHQNRAKALKRMFLFLTGMATIAVAGIYFANPSAFIFLVYKFSFFINVILGNDIGQSASVRVFEMRNIVAESIERIYPVFIGKGYGAYFSFVRSPIPFALGDGSYVPNSLKLQRYVNPHGFVQYCYLKGGVLFLSYYLGLICTAALLAVRRMRSGLTSPPFLVVLLPFLCLFALNMFWRPPVIFLFFLIFNIVLLDKNEPDDCCISSQS